MTRRLLSLLPLLVLLLFCAAAPALAVSDAEIEARLERIYVAMDGFGDVQVRVVEGVVMLSGPVESEAARQRAKEVAAAVEGVIHIDSELTVDTAPRRRIELLWESFTEVGSRFLDLLPALLTALTLVVLFAIVGRLIRFVPLPRRLTGSLLLANAVRRLLGLALLAVGVLAALEVLGLTSVAGAILGAAGLFGLAVGFALQDIIENFLAGLLLSIRSPFSVNDWVAIGDQAGSVVRLTSRELVLMTLDGNHVRLPNAYVFKSVILNYTRNPLRGFSFPVGVGLEEDLDNVQRVGTRALALMPGVMADPGPFMRVADLGDFSVTVRFFGWVDQREYDFLKVEGEAKRVVKSALDAAEIVMPLPEQIVRVVRDQVEQPHAPEAERTDQAERAAQVAASRADVARDSHLDRQIDADRAASTESNLLQEKKPSRTT